METISQEMIDAVDDALGTLWLQMFQFGNDRIQLEIEEVAEPFFRPLVPAEVMRETIDRAHELFARVHAEYREKAPPWLWRGLVTCPHCKREE